MSLLDKTLRLITNVNDQSVHLINAGNQYGHTLTTQAKLRLDLVKLASYVMNTEFTPNDATEFAVWRLLCELNERKDMPSIKPKENPLLNSYAILKLFNNAVEAISSQFENSANELMELLRKDENSRAALLRLSQSTPCSAGAEAYAKAILHNLNTLEEQDRKIDSASRAEVAAWLADNAATPDALAGVNV